MGFSSTRCWALCRSVAGCFNHKDQGLHVSSPAEACTTIHKAVNIYMTTHHHHQTTILAPYNHPYCQRKFAVNKASPTWLQCGVFTSCWFCEVPFSRIRYNLWYLYQGILMDSSCLHLIRAWLSICLSACWVRRGPNRTVLQVLQIIPNNILSDHLQLCANELERIEPFCYFTHAPPTYFSTSCACTSACAIE